MSGDQGDNTKRLTVEEAMNRYQLPRIGEAGHVPFGNTVGFLRLHGYRADEILADTGLAPNSDSVVAHYLIKGGYPAREVVETLGWGVYGSHGDMQTTLQNLRAAGVNYPDDALEATGLCDAPPEMQKLELTAAGYKVD